MSCHRDVGAWAASPPSGVSKAGRPGRFRSASAMPLQTFSRAEPPGSSCANPIPPPSAFSLLPGASPLKGTRKLPSRSMQLSYLEVALIAHHCPTGPAAAASASVSNSLPDDKMVTAPATAAVAGVQESEVAFRPATAANVSAIADPTRVLKTMSSLKPDTVSASSIASGDREDRMPICGTRAPEPKVPLKPETASAFSDAGGDQVVKGPTRGTRVPEPTTTFKPDTVTAPSDATSDYEDRMPALGTRAPEHKTSFQKNTVFASPEAPGNHKDVMPDIRRGAGPSKPSKRESEETVHHDVPVGPGGGLPRDPNMMLSKPAAEIATGAATASALDDTAGNEPEGLLTRRAEDSDLKKPNVADTRVASTAATDEPNRRNMPSKPKKPTATATAAGAIAAIDEPKTGAGRSCRCSGGSEKKVHWVAPKRPVGGLLRDPSTLTRQPTAVEATGAAIANALDDITGNEPGGLPAGHIENCDLMKPSGTAMKAATTAASDEPRSRSMPACNGNGGIESLQRRAESERPGQGLLRYSSTRKRRPSGAEFKELSPAAYGKIAELRNTTLVYPPTQRRPTVAENEDASRYQASRVFANHAPGYYCVEPLYRALVGNTSWRCGSARVDKAKGPRRTQKISKSQKNSQPRKSLVRTVTPGAAKLKDGHATSGKTKCPKKYHRPILDRNIVEARGSCKANAFREVHLPANGDAECASPPLRLSKTNHCPNLPGHETTRRACSWFGPISDDWPRWTSSVDDKDNGDTRNQPPEEHANSPGDHLQAIGPVPQRDNMDRRAPALCKPQMARVEDHDDWVIVGKTLRRSELVTAAQIPEQVLPSIDPAPSGSYDYNDNDNDNDNGSSIGSEFLVRSARGCKSLTPPFSTDDCVPGSAPYPTTVSHVLRGGDNYNDNDNVNAPAYPTRFDSDSNSERRRNNDNDNGSSTGSEILVRSACGCEFPTPLFSTTDCVPCSAPYPATVMFTLGLQTRDPEPHEGIKDRGHNLPQVHGPDDEWPTADPELQGGATDHELLQLRFLENKEGIGAFSALQSAVHRNLDPPGLGGSIRNYPQHHQVINDRTYRPSQSTEGANDYDDDYISGAVDEGLECKEADGNSVRTRDYDYNNYIESSADSVDESTPDNEQCRTSTVAHSTLPSFLNFCKPTSRVRRRAEAQPARLYNPDNLCWLISAARLIAFNALGDWKRAAMACTAPNRQQTDVTRLLREILPGGIALQPFKKAMSLRQLLPHRMPVNHALTFFLIRAIGAGSRRCKNHQAITLAARICINGHYYLRSTAILHVGAHAHTGHNTIMHQIHNGNTQCMTYDNDKITEGQWEDAATTWVACVYVAHPVPPPLTSPLRESKLTLGRPRLSRLLPRRVYSRGYHYDGDFVFACSLQAPLRVPECTSNSLKLHWGRFSYAPETLTCRNRRRGPLPSPEGVPTAAQDPLYYEVLGITLTTPATSGAGEAKEEGVRVKPARPGVWRKGRGGKKALPTVDTIPSLCTASSSSSKQLALAESRPVASKFIRLSVGKTCVKLDENEEFSKTLCPRWDNEVPAGDETDCGSSDAERSTMLAADPLQPPLLQPKLTPAATESLTKAPAPAPSQVGLVSRSAAEDEPIDQVDSPAPGLGRSTADAAAERDCNARTIIIDPALPVWIILCDRSRPQDTCVCIWPHPANTDMCLAPEMPWNQKGDNVLDDLQLGIKHLRIITPQWPKGAGEHERADLIAGTSSHSVLPDQGYPFQAYCRLMLDRVGLEIDVLPHFANELVHCTFNCTRILCYACWGTHWPRCAGMVPADHGLWGGSNTDTTATMSAADLGPPITEWNVNTIRTAWRLLHQLPATAHPSLQEQVTLRDIAERIQAHVYQQTALTPEKDHSHHQSSSSRRCQHFEQMGLTPEWDRPYSRPTPSASSEGAGLYQHVEQTRLTLERDSLGPAPVTGSSEYFVGLWKQMMALQACAPEAVAIATMDLRSVHTSGGNNSCQDGLKFVDVRVLHYHSGLAIRVNEETVTSPESEMWRRLISHHTALSSHAVYFNRPLQCPGFGYMIRIKKGGQVARTIGVGENLHSDITYVRITSPYRMSLQSASASSDLEAGCRNVANHTALVPNRNCGPPGPHDWMTPAQRRQHLPDEPGYIGLGAPGPSSGSGAPLRSPPDSLGTHEEYLARVAKDNCGTGLDWPAPKPGFDITPRGRHGGRTLETTVSTEATNRSPAYWICDHCHAGVIAVDLSECVMCSTPGCRRCLPEVMCSQCEDYPEIVRSADLTPGLKGGARLGEDTGLPTPNVELPEDDGAIYCDLRTQFYQVKQVWINGQTQWADHQVGRKHLRARRRTQVQGRLPPPTGVPTTSEAVSSLIHDTQQPPAYLAIELPDYYGTIYCRLCDTRFNGHTQRLEHLAGRKHLTTLRRTQAQGSPPPYTEVPITLEAVSPLVHDRQQLPSQSSIETFDDDGAIYCRPCDMWLNGQTQLWDHLGGKKHLTTLRKHAQWQHLRTLRKQAQDRLPSPTGVSTRRSSRRSFTGNPFQEIMSLNPLSVSTTPLDSKAEHIVEHRLWLNLELYSTRSCRRQLTEHGVEMAMAKTVNLMITIAEDFPRGTTERPWESNMVWCPHYFPPGSDEDTATHLVFTYSGEPFRGEPSVEAKTRGIRSHTFTGTAQVASTWLYWAALGGGRKMSCVRVDDQEHIYLIKSLRRNQLTLFPTQPVAPPPDALRIRAALPPTRRRPQDNENLDAGGGSQRQTISKTELDAITVGLHRRQLYPAPTLVRLLADNVEVRTRLLNAESKKGVNWSKAQEEPPALGKAYDSAATASKGKGKCKTSGKGSGKDKKVNKGNSGKGSSYAGQSVQETEFDPSWKLRASDWNTPILQSAEFFTSDVTAIALAPMKRAKVTLRHRGIYEYAKAILTFAKFCEQATRLEVPLVTDEGIIIRSLWITQLGNTTAQPFALQTSQHTAVLTTAGTVEVVAHLHWAGLTGETITELRELGVSKPDQAGGKQPSPLPRLEPSQWAELKALLERMIAVNVLGMRGLHLAPTALVITLRLHAAKRLFSLQQSGLGGVVIYLVSQSDEFSVMRPSHDLQIAGKSAWDQANTLHTLLLQEPSFAGIISTAKTNMARFQAVEIENYRLILNPAFRPPAQGETAYLIRVSADVDGHDLVLALGVQGWDCDFLNSDIGGARQTVRVSAPAPAGHTEFRMSFQDQTLFATIEPKPMPMTTSSATTTGTGPSTASGSGTAGLTQNLLKTTGTTATTGGPASAANTCGTTSQPPPTGGPAGAADVGRTTSHPPPGLVRGTRTSRPTEPMGGRTTFRSPGRTNNVEDVDNDGDLNLNAGGTSVTLKDSDWNPVRSRYNNNGRVMVAHISNMAGTFRYLAITYCAINMDLEAPLDHDRGKHRAALGSTATLSLSLVLQNLAEGDLLVKGHNAANRKAKPDEQLRTPDETLVVRRANRLQGLPRMLWEHKGNPASRQDQPWTLALPSLEPLSKNIRMIRHMATMVDAARCINNRKQNSNRPSSYVGGAAQSGQKLRQGPSPSQQNSEPHIARTQFFVKTSQGKTVVLNAPADASIIQACEEKLGRIGVKCTDCHYIHEGRPLARSDTLRGRQVKPKQHVFCTERVRGGAQNTSIQVFIETTFAPWPVVIQAGIHEKIVSYCKDIVRRMRRTVPDCYFTHQGRRLTSLDTFIARQVRSGQHIICIRVRGDGSREDARSTLRQDTGSLAWHNSRRVPRPEDHWPIGVHASERDSWRDHRRDDQQTSGEKGNITASAAIPRSFAPDWLSPGALFAGDEDAPCVRIGTASAPPPLTKKPMICPGRGRGQCRKKPGPDPSAAGQMTLSQLALDYPNRGKPHKVGTRKERSDTASKERTDPEPHEGVTDQIKASAYPLHPGYVEGHGDAMKIQLATYACHPEAHTTTSDPEPHGGATERVDIGWLPAGHGGIERRGYIQSRMPGWPLPRPGPPPPLRPPAPRPKIWTTLAPMCRSMWGSLLSINGTQMRPGLSRSASVDCRGDLGSEYPPA
ncbi:unnamed protein product [Polarella glacialis]|uniref:Uncharacterized protein n=1 Tax=Polarella glacialis TaxID=89957 RepID=A0A813HG90_POLGL|nr:unnamed protein product [Polarella glacialis]